MMLLWLSTKEIAGNCDSYICLEFLWLLFRYFWVLQSVIGFMLICVSFERCSACSFMPCPVVQCWEWYNWAGFVTELVTLSMWEIHHSNCGEGNWTELLCASNKGTVSAFIKSTSVYL